MALFQLLTEHIVEGKRVCMSIHAERENIRGDGVLTLLIAHGLKTPRTMLI